MPDMGIFEALENPDEIVRAIFGRGNCRRFGGQWDTLTSWGWNEAYQKAYTEFIYPTIQEKRAEQEEMGVVYTFGDMEELKERMSEPIYSEILPKWWQMFLDCLTENMRYINKTNRWQVIDHRPYQEKRMKKFTSGKWKGQTREVTDYLADWVPTEVIEASNGEELLTQVFMKESGIGHFPNDPKDNDYFVYTARRYFGNAMTGGFVIQRYYSTKERNINGNLRLVQPTL